MKSCIEKEIIKHDKNYAIENELNTDKIDEKINNNFNDIKHKYGKGQPKYVCGPNGFPIPITDKKTAEFLKRSFNDLKNVEKIMENNIGESSSVLEKSSNEVNHQDLLASESINSIEKEDIGHKINVETIQNILEGQDDIPQNEKKEILFDEK